MRIYYRLKSEEEFELLQSIAKTNNIRFCSNWESLGIREYPDAVYDDEDGDIAGTVNPGGTGVYETLSDFVGAVLIEHFKPGKIILSVSDDYCAKYMRGDSHIKVGCQKIEVSTLRELLTRIDKVNNQQ